MKCPLALTTLLLCTACTQTLAISQLCSEGSTTFVLNVPGEREGMLGQSNPVRLNIQHACATPDFEFTSPWEDLVEYQGAGSFRFLRPGWFKGQFKNGTQRKPQVLLAWASPEAQKVKALDRSFLEFNKLREGSGPGSFDINLMRDGPTLFEDRADFLLWREAQLKANHNPPSVQVAPQQPPLTFPEEGGSILLVVARETYQDVAPVVTHLEESSTQHLHLAQPRLGSVTELVPAIGASKRAYLYQLPWKLKADTPVSFHRMDESTTI